MSNQPLVSIGLPTYNRASSLGRALESALMQDYQNIEVVISDNGSIDETQAICLKACEGDKRIRYSRFKTNQGPTANFREVLKQARGEFFLWFADDDWLDKSYVSQCVQKLINNPDHSLVSGAVNYYQDGQFLFESETLILPQESAEERLVAYYQRVTANGAFYGVMRRRQVSAVTFPNVLGGDWLLTAAMAFLGKTDVVASTSLGRSWGGASKSTQSITKVLGVSDLYARAPNLSIALAACRDVAWKSEAYASLGRAARLSLARKVFAVFARRYFDPYWRSALRPYLRRPYLFIVSLGDRIRTKSSG